MRKLLYLFLAAVLLTWAGAAFAADDVVSTKHNLTAAGPGTYKLTGVDGTDQVCAFCHTPHNPNPVANAPLWNRFTDATGFTMYSSDTLDMTIQGQPEGVTLACLSCHDGVIAFDQLLNAPGSGDYDPAGTSRLWTFTPGSTLSGAGITEIGKDLSGDHPISIVYDPVADTAFQPIATVTATLPLYTGTGSNQVECASCHNPHEAILATFLRIDNAQSALCTTCHIK